MRRLLGLLALLPLLSPAGATETTRAALQTQNTASITTNGAGQISGASLRTLLANIIDSSGMLQSANSWTGQNVFNGATNFTGTVVFSASFMPATTCAAGQFISALTTLGVGTCSAPTFPALTGYVYANGASPPTASPTIPSSAIPGFHGGALTDAVAVCGADPTGVADSTSAINTCLSTYKAVGLPAGTYKTTSTINVPTAATLCGAGDGGSVISLNNVTGAAVSVAANADKVTLCDLQVTRVGIPVGAAYGVLTSLTTIITQSTFTNVHVWNHQIGFVLGPTDFSTCEWCISEKNYGDGFYFTNNTTWNILQWALRYTLSQKNDGWGYQMVGAVGTVNTIQGIPWIGVHSYANTGGGIRFLGQAAVPINGINIQDCVLSYDGNDELQIQAYDGRYAKVSNCYIEGAGTATTGRALTTPASNVGKGISILNGIGDISISGSTIETNSQIGIGASGAAASLLIEGNQIIRNGVATANTYDGISIDGTTMAKVIVSNNSAFNDLSAAQRYGVVISAPATQTIVSNNNMTGATGGCLLNNAIIVEGNFGSGCSGKSINSIILAGAAVSLTTATAANVTSVSLPAGDWTCTGNVNFYPNVASTITAVAGWIGTASAAIPTRPNSGAFAETTATLTTGGNQTLPVGGITFTLGATTTVYLEAYSTFGVSTMTAGGFLGCRRAL